MHIRKQALKFFALTALFTTAIPVQAFFDARSLWSSSKKSAISQLIVGASILGLGIYRVYRLYNASNSKKSDLEANLKQFTEVGLLAVEDQITFDREFMPLRENSKSEKVEGYWASSSNPKDDVCGGRYPFPKKNEKPWVGKEAFLKKLESMEKIALYKSMSNGKRLCFTAMKGSARSRIDKTRVGCGEFSDIDNGISWPQGYGQHYIDTYNVVPSREFYHYVMNYRLS